MDQEGSTGTGFSTRVVADGAAVEVILRSRFLNYDVSDSLKERLRTSISDALLEGHRAFVLELSAVERIDSCGVGTLIAMHHQIADAGGSLAIAGVCEFVQKLLHMMQLDRFLSVHASTERALKAVVDPL